MNLGGLNNANPWQGATCCWVGNDPIEAHWLYLFFHSSHVYKVHAHMKLRWTTSAWVVGQTGAVLTNGGVARASRTWPKPTPQLCCHWSTSSMVCWASSRNSTAYLLKVVNGVWVMALSVFCSQRLESQVQGNLLENAPWKQQKGWFWGAQKLARLSRAMTSASRKLCATSTRVCFLAANAHLHEASVFLALIDDPGVTSMEHLTDAVPMRFVVESDDGL